MEKTNYYDGTKLLSLKDINGEIPEIYICTSNRSAGKTTWFNRYALNQFKKKHEKFMLLYRFNYELESCAEKFFKDINGLFFPDDVMTSFSRARGTYHELFLNDISCGYACSINSADQIKKMSHLFSDTSRMIFDEFQSETNNYCTNELSKLISIHQSVARGQNKQVRYVPVYMVGNPVSIINPYYVGLGISDRLKDDTKFLRGDGFVLEQGFNECASKAQNDSAFNRAFAREKYVAYASQNIYLNDNQAFVETPSGKSQYVCTLKYNNVEYGIREYDCGIVYCNTKPDLSHPFKISVLTDDMQINYVMLKRNAYILTRLRYYFEHGCFRFKDLRCKEVVLKALSY